MSVLNILSVSKEIAELNKGIREQIKIEKEREKEDLINLILKKERKDNYKKNSKQVKTLELLNFQINRFEKGKNLSDYGNHDTYYCQYNDWVFVVKYFKDPDIEEGILALYDPINTKTKEVVRFYCDLWCNNTSKERLNDLLYILNNGVNKFMKKKYSHLIELPEFLIEKGLEIIIVDYEFSPNCCHGHIKVILKDYGFKENTCIIKVSDVSSEGSTLVLMKEKTECLFGHYQNKHRFNYKGKEDIEELIRCIKCFLEEVNGEYGYYENDRFYNGKDIDKLINEIKWFAKKYYYEDYNYNRIDISDSVIGNLKAENHYKGVEIYKKYKVVFDNCFPENGKTIRQTYYITFEYDKNKDDKNCLLEIEMNLRNGSKYNLPQKEVTVMKGPFLHLRGILKFFLCSLFKNNGYSLYSKNEGLCDKFKEEQLEE